MKSSVSNVRSLFTFSLVLFERQQQIIRLHQYMELTVKTNVTWLLCACPISKSVRFSSVLNFRVATKILFYQNSIAKFISFLFLRAFHQSNLITTAVKFSVDLNRKQENGNTRSPHQSAKQKNFIAYTDFDTIRHHPNSPVLP